METRESALGLAMRMADSAMEYSGLLTDGWHYDYGVMWRGMEALYALTGEKRYDEYISKAFDAIVGADGTIRDYHEDEYNLDYLCNGRQLLSLYKRTGEARFAKALRALRRQLQNQPRTADGGFWHKKCYPYQMWLDGLHMAAPFYLEYALMENEGQYAIDDVARQLCLAYAHTLDEPSGLNRHAWDESRQADWADPVTGRAAHSWGRAVGWYIAALVDCLALLPREQARYGELATLFKAMAEKLLAIRQGGVWLQVLDCPNRAGNYAESSASCLIDYALLKGARLGLLPKEQSQAARESFGEIVRQFVFQMRNGRVFLAKCCFGAGLGGAKHRDGSYAYYISEAVGSNDLKGTGAFLQAACEMARAKSVM